MPQITKVGLELAVPLLRSYEKPYPTEVFRAVSEICSLICRNGPSYRRLQEARSNNPSFTAANEREEAAIEARVNQLVSRLPPATGGRLGVEFNGDPRGHTIKITRPPHTDSHNDYVGVPNS